MIYILKKNVQNIFIFLYLFFVSYNLNAFCFKHIFYIYLFSLKTYRPHYVNWWILHR